MSHMARTWNLGVEWKVSVTVFVSQEAVFPARYTASHEELSTRILILFGSRSTSETSGLSSAAVLLHGGPPLEATLIAIADPPIGLPIGFDDDPYPLAEEDPGSCCFELWLRGRTAADLAQAASSASWLILFGCGGDTSVLASERGAKRRSCFHPGTGTFAIIGIWISSDSGIGGAEKRGREAHALLRR